MPGVIAAVFVASVPVIVQLTGAAPRLAFSLLPCVIVALLVAPAWLLPIDASVLAGVVLHAASVNAVTLPRIMLVIVVFMSASSVVVMKA